MNSVTFGVCNVSIAPLRRKAEDRSEMISQLLFGECVEILDQVAENWIYVRCLLDDYQGFMDPKQLYYTTKEEISMIQNCRQFVMQTGFANNSEEESIHLTTGANLPNFDGISSKLPFGTFRFADQIIDVNTAVIHGDTIEKITRKYLNTPYLWGGRSSFGIDCSGLTQLVYKMVGINIPRDAKDQAKWGDTIAFVESAVAGDLAFFSNEKNRIIHVGVICESGEIIHASGKVRTDLLDHHGIYNENLGKYTHELRTIKRIVDSRYLKRRVKRLTQQAEDESE